MASLPEPPPVVSVGRLLPPLPEQPNAKAPSTKNTPIRERGCRMLLIEHSVGLWFARPGGDGARLDLGPGRSAGRTLTPGPTGGLSTRPVGDRAAAQGIAKALFACARRRLRRRSPIAGGTGNPLRVPN